MNATSLMPEVVLGQQLSDLQVIDLTINGGALARLESCVVFLDKGVPGDSVSAVVTAIKKNCLEAEVSEITTLSADRVQPCCIHAAECGGCSWQHYSTDAALNWKARHVVQALKRIGCVSNCPSPQLIASPTYTAFRNKVSYAFGGDGETALIGLKQRKSHTIVEVTACQLQPRVAMDILQVVRDFLRETPLPAWENGSGYLRHLVIHTPFFRNNGKASILVECITAPDVSADNFQEKSVHSLGTRLCSSGLGVTGFVHSIRKSRLGIAEGEFTVFTIGDAHYTEQLGSLPLVVPHGVFLQTNTGAAGCLYEEVKQFAGLTGKEVVWDVYCGAGAIGLYLGAQAKTVKGFEIQRQAVEAARANAIQLGLSECSFEAGQLLHVLRKETTVPDVIIVDPPRAGMEATVTQIIKQTQASKLVYVSCDAATLARDIAILQPDWDVRKLSIVDMFPYTPHVESVVLLERK